MDVEDKYDVIIQNYLEFEFSILEETTRELLEPSRTAVENQRVRRLFARRLSNVLSSARLYLDTLDHHSKQIVTDDPIGLDRIQKAPSVEYDRSLNYRVIEALRNHAQHSSLPVHGLTVGTTQNAAGVTYSIDPHLDLDQLRADKKFKAKVLHELEQQDDDIFLKPAIRSYIESLGAIQQTFRNNTEAPHQRALQRMRKAKAQFVELHPSEGTIALAAVRSSASEDYAEVVYIIGHREAYLEYFKSQAIHMLNFSQRRVEY